MNFNISNISTIFSEAAATNAKDGAPVANTEINPSGTPADVADQTGANADNTLGSSDLLSIFGDICPISGDVYASMKNAAADPKNLKIVATKSGDGDSADLFVEAVEFMNFLEASEMGIGEGAEAIIGAYKDECPGLENGEFHVVFPEDCLKKNDLGCDEYGKAIRNTWPMELLRGCRRYGLKVNAGVEIKPTNEAAADQKKRQ